MSQNRQAQVNGHQLVVPEEEQDLNGRCLSPVFSNGRLGDQQTNGYHGVEQNGVDLGKADTHECSNTGEIEGIPPSAAHDEARPEYFERITIPLNDVPASTPTRRLRVVIIGAGYSGMIMVQKLQHKYAEEMGSLLDFVVYEARTTVGGTWHANSYPGVRCDVPSAIYAFPFEPNPE